jgi:hypothetical protein
VQFNCWNRGIRFGSLDEPSLLDPFKDLVRFRLVLPGLGFDAHANFDFRLHAGEGGYEIRDFFRQGLNLTDIECDGVGKLPSGRDWQWFNDYRFALPDDQGNSPVVLERREGTGALRSDEVALAYRRVNRAEKERFGPWLPARCFDGRVE